MKLRGLDKYTPTHTPDPESLSLLTHVHTPLCAYLTAAWCGWNEQPEQITGLHPFQGKAKRLCQLNAKFQFQWSVCVPKLLAIKSYIHWNNWQSGSQDGRVNDRYTGAVINFPSGSTSPQWMIWKRRKTPFEILYPEAKAFNGHCLRVTWGGGIMSMCQCQKASCDRQLIHYSGILNISGERQEAHEINISNTALQKEVALHLSHID